jgi:electron transport complex protein RnfD
MNSKAAKFTVGSAPHWRSRTSITKMNMAFILALVPTLFAGAIAHSFGSRAVEINAAFGPVNPIVKLLVVEMGVDSGVLWLFGILGTVLLALGVGLMAEYLIQIVMRQPYHATNGHGALMGLLMALLSPPGIPWWMLALGIFVAILVGKQLFGGLGSYPMHPAMVGWLILLLSWPHALYPVGAASIGAPEPGVVFVTALGGLALCWLGYVRWQTPLGVLLGVAVFTLIFGGSLKGGIYEQLTSGHVMIAAFFIATDSTCSPANRLAVFLYGILVGALIMLIRAFGVWPDAIPFAILLANLLNPHLDRIRPAVRRVVVA